MSIISNIQRLNTGASLVRCSQYVRRTGTSLVRCRVDEQRDLTVDWTTARTMYCVNPHSDLLQVIQINNVLRYRTEKYTSSVVQDTNKSHNPNLKTLQFHKFNLCYSANIFNVLQYLAKNLFYLLSIIGFCVILVLFIYYCLYTKTILIQFLRFMNLNIEVK